MTSFASPALGPFEAVADRVYVAVAEPAAVNIGLVVGSQAALVVDTGSSPAQGAEILASAREMAGGVPVTHVAVTHAHFDHLFGLAAFDALASYGHEQLAAGLAAERPPAEQLAALGVADADIVAPGHTFSLTAVLPLGDCHAELFHFGRGHTDHDVVVLVPERGVVFAGDLLETAAFPSVGEDSFLDEWPRTLDWTLGTLRAHTVVVPGHGPTLGQDAALLQQTQLAWLETHAGRLWEAGTRVEDAWGTSEQWPLPREAAEAALRVRFAQYAAEGRPRTRSLPLLGR
ncbi:MAG: MBL fold metallo-hydrolase [Propionibacteriaceae bacterium]|nr:MBL fold metallo-hydrolase [Propionibacteriaceae bacterium]